MYGVHIHANFSIFSWKTNHHVSGHGTGAILKLRRPRDWTEKVSCKVDID